MPSTFGIVRSGKVRVKAVASPLESENFDNEVCRLGSAISFFSLLGFLCDSQNLGFAGQGGDGRTNPPSHHNFFHKKGESPIRKSFFGDFGERALIPV